VQEKFLNLGTPLTTWYQNKAGTFCKVKNELVLLLL